MPSRAVAVFPSFRPLTPTERHRRGIVQRRPHPLARTSGVAAASSAAHPWPLWPAVVVHGRTGLGMTVAMVMVRADPPNPGPHVGQMDRRWVVVRVRSVPVRARAAIGRPWTAGGGEEAGTVGGDSWRALPGRGRLHGHQGAMDSATREVRQWRSARSAAPA